MGQNGQIVFYTERSVQSPQRLIRGTIDIVDADRVWLATRSIGEDREWASMHPPLLSVRRLRLAWRDLVLSVKGSLVMVVEDDTDIVGQDVTPEQVEELYREGTCLRFQFAGDPLGTRLWEAIKLAIPAEVAGNFEPASPSIAVGGHDIWEDAEHERGHLFGRAAFSLGIFGYGTPADWKRYREMIFDVPEVMELQKRLEELAGPMKRCVYWSV